MSESYKSCGYRIIINTRVGVGAHNSIKEVNIRTAEQSSPQDVEV